MSTTDRKIKNIDVRVKDANGKVRVVNLIEHDTVNLKYKDPETSKTVHVETGEIIKIGVHTNLDNSESIYLIVIAYNYYLENNVFYIPVSALTQVITVNHSTTQYTISPVYTPDESVALLRSEGECLEFTVNGKDWIKCNGGSGSDITIDDVDREIEKYIRDVPLVSESQVDEKIATATEDFVTEETVTNIVDQATRDFVTENQVDSKIADATADFVTMTEVDSEIDTKVAEATEDFVTGEQVDEKISEATSDFITESQATSLIDQATRDFVTGAQVDSKIAEATEDFVTMDQVDSEIDTKVAEATADFVTGDQVDEKIADATSDFITESQATSLIDQATRDFVTGAQVDSKIAEATADFITREEAEADIDEKIAEAVEDLATHEEVDNKIATAVQDFVTAQEVDEKIAEATEDFVTMPEVDSEIDTKLEPYATLDSPTFTGDVKVPTVAQSVDDDTAASTSYVRDAIDDLKEELAGAFHFKGVVATYEDLEAIENPEIGDVYQVTTSPAGENAEYAYTSEKGWIELGTVIDLSGYATLEELDRVADATLESANSYTDEAIAALEDPYALCVAKGYQGTKDDFYTALTDVLMHVNVIPIVDDLNS